MANSLYVTCWKWLLDQYTIYDTHYNAALALIRLGRLPETTLIFLHQYQQQRGVHIVDSCVLYVGCTSYCGL